MIYVLLSFYIGKILFLDTACWERDVTCLALTAQVVNWNAAFYQITLWRIWLIRIKLSSWEIRLQCNYIFFIVRLHKKTCLKIVTFLHTVIYVSFFSFVAIHNNVIHIIQDYTWYFIDTVIHISFYRKINYECISVDGGRKFLLIW